MKQNLHAVLNNKFLVAAVVVCISIFGIVSSCKTSRSNSNYANQFLCTWTIRTSTCNTIGSSFTITSDGIDQLYQSRVLAGAGCLKSFNLSGSATANGFVFPTNSFVDICGYSYTVSEVGTLSGNTLTVTVVYSGDLNTTCTETATK